MQKLEIKWTNLALEDFTYYANYYRKKARLTIASRFASKVEKALDILACLPHISRAGRKASTQEFIMQEFPFIIEIRVRSNNLEILAFLHQKRRIE